jgi:hypothetical protein
LAAAVFCLTPPRLEAAAVVQRSLAYHQISSFTTQMNTGAPEAPIISRDGNFIAYAMAPGTGNPATPNKIFRINADGSGNHEVDSYTTFCFCGSMIDISDNGGKIISSDAVQLRIANGDGTGRRTLFALDSNEINSIKISGDGSKVFFRISRNTSVRGSNPAIPIERGIYSINPDGTGFANVISPAKIAPVMGITEPEVSFFDNLGRNGLDSSTNASRISFALFFPPVGSGGTGQAIFGANGDGTAIHQILERTAFVSACPISGDGTKVGYRSVNFTDPIDEAGVVNFDGTGRRKLADNTVAHPGTGFSLPDSGDRLQLSQDGSKLLLGSTGLLYNTDGSDVLQLGAIGGTFTSTPLLAVGEGLGRPTMNANATRFEYLTPTGNDSQAFNTIPQLATIELNPTTLGSAPTVSEPSIDPPFILLNAGNSATVKGKVVTNNTLIVANTSILIPGMWSDPNVSWNVLFDDGTHGDQVASDKVNTSNEVRANCCATFGPRIVRLKGEVRTSNGRRHATAIDFTPFAVVDALPLPTITNLHPKRARRGSDLVNSLITGTNFLNGSTSVDFLLAGAPDPKITVSNLTVVDENRLLLTIAIAPDAAIGARVVRVTTQAGASTTTANSANTFTVTDLPDPTDIDPPAISDNSVSPTALPAAGGKVDFGAVVSDNRDIRSVSVEITKPGGTKTTVPLVLQAGAPSLDSVSGRYAGSFTAPANTTAANQVYKVLFIAKDNANNQTSVRGEPFVVPGTVPDTDPPSNSANTVTPIELPRAGGTVSLSLVAKDNVDVASARVKITKPDNTTQTVDLTRQSAATNSDLSAVTVRFTGSFNIPANTGVPDQRYRTEFFAKDGAGNEAGPVNGDSVIVKGCATPPAISNATVKPRNLPSSGGKITVSAKVTSCVNNPTVTAQLIKIVSGAPVVVLNITMQRGNGDNFSGAGIVPPNKSKRKSATYGVVINASDSVGSDGPEPAGSVTVAKKR